MHPNLEVTNLEVKGKIMTLARQTTNHDEIRNWVEERNGRPSKVNGSAEAGILRIDFGEPDKNLKPIDWNEFFSIFEGARLAFLCQDDVGYGERSRFNKFISRAH